MRLYRSLVVARPAAVAVGFLGRKRLLDATEPTDRCRSRDVGYGPLQRGSDGTLETFASNRVGSHLAGTTLAPDSSTLFVNLQIAGLTAAITGPWRRGSS